MNKAVERFIKPEMDKRFRECLDIILKSEVNFKELGVFGSYARGDYNSTSDIDFYMIVDSKPDRIKSCLLRELLDEKKAELLFITTDTFNKSETLLYENIRRDCRKVEINEKRLL